MKQPISRMTADDASIMEMFDRAMRARAGQQRADQLHWVIEAVRTELTSKFRYVMHNPRAPQHGMWRLMTLVAMATAVRASETLQQLDEINELFVGAIGEISPVVLQLYADVRNLELGDRKQTKSLEETDQWIKQLQAQVADLEQRVTRLDGGSVK